MKILAVSNLYPPLYIGGYELGCRDVLEGLKARGHQVKVLASTYGVGRPQSDGEVYRWLRLLPLHEKNRIGILAKTIAKELEQRLSLARLLREWKPDVLYVWNLTGLSLNLPLVAESRGIPVCYFISDHWLLEWDAGKWRDFCKGSFAPRVGHLVKSFVFPVGRCLGFVPARPLELGHVQFASSFLKQAATKAGKLVSNAEVIHWGVQIADFPFREVKRLPSRLLFVGQVAPQKGVHTAIEAMELLVHEYGCRSMRLSIFGGYDEHAEYPKEIKKLVDSLALSEHVQFRGFLPRSDLPAMYSDHDILIFPSVWEEPFSIVVLEAMASGLALVGTHTGGSPEVMRDEVNSLVFPKGDAQSCAAQVLRLVKDVNLCESLRRAARRVVEENFTLEAMIDQVEASLLRLLSKHRT